MSTDAAVATAPTSAAVRVCAPPNLLTIAPELRNKIYALVLIRDHSITPRPRWRRNEPPDVTRALTQTSHQLRSEALPLYFGLNTFVISGHDKFGGLDVQHVSHRSLFWLYFMREEAVSSIRHLHLECTAPFGEILEELDLERKENLVIKIQTFPQNPRGSLLVTRTHGQCESYVKQALLIDESVLVSPDLI